MNMNKLLEMLKDGNARSLEMLAAELNTSVGDVERMLEYMENMGLLRKTELGKVGHQGCSSCAGCSASKDSAAVCKGCLPEKGFENMGVIWEVI